MYSKLINFNFSLRLEIELNIVSLLKTLTIKNIQGGDVSLFNTEIEMKDLFYKYDPDNQDRVLNSHDQNRVILKHYLESG